MITLTGLFVYPVKSARGIALDRATLTECGLSRDRRFMVVDDAGHFLTQRKLPQLARLETAFEGDGLRLTWPGLGSEYVPLAPSSGARRRVRVWDDDVSAISPGATLDSFISRALGVSAGLVYLPDECMRVPSLEFAKETDRVGFADGFPYLLASEDSLADLSIRARCSIPMDRFRANLVVRGAEAYAEDRWREIVIGGVRFELVKPCTRCVMTTTDQQTGERRGPEPLATLAGYRRWRGEAAFAQNAVARDPGTLQLGDVVRVNSVRSVP